MASKSGTIDFMIHQDENDENSVVAKKAKVSDVDPPANKRVALGAITNTNAPRVQPFRAVKQPVGESSSLKKLPAKISQLALGKQKGKEKKFLLSFGSEEKENNGGKKLSRPVPVIHEETVPHRGSLDVKENLKPPKEEPFAIHKESIMPPAGPIMPDDERFADMIETDDDDSESENSEFDGNSPFDISQDDDLSQFDDDNKSQASITCDTACSTADLSPINLDASHPIHPERTIHFMTVVIEVVEYKDEILHYLKATETRLQPKPDYITKQPDLTMPMRSILIDWLVEVSEEYKLQRQTFCICVTFIDRFLSQMSVMRGKLQLVGAAAMFIASKFEEIYPPEIHEFVYITDDTYNKKQILKMEQLILKVLQFDLSTPTANVFLEMFLRYLAIPESDDVFNLAMYLMELSLVYNENLTAFPPSKIAAAAFCLANFTLEKDDIWPSKIEKFTGYMYSQLTSCVEAMHILYQRARSLPQQAVQEKYKQLKYNRVSVTFSAPESISISKDKPTEEMLVTSFKSEIV